MQSGDMSPFGPTLIAPVRILVLDDDRDRLLATFRLVEHIGHEARMAACPDEGMGQLQDFRPDVVLIDTEMSGMAGMVAARRIHQLDVEEAPVLAAMAPEPGLQSQCAEAGFDHFLVKPVAPGDLDQLVRLVRPDKIASTDFMVLQARHRDVVVAFTDAQLAFCELMLDLAERSRRDLDRERQLRTAERSLGKIAAWLEKHTDMPRQRWHSIRSQFAVLNYRLAQLKD